MYSRVKSSIMSTVNKMASRFRRTSSGDTELLSEVPPDLVTSVTHEGETSGTLQYEELHPGSVPCPTCYGSGKIPKEREGELVALIPINDKRLKPRRTALWVSIGVCVCVFICGLCLFFLLPRTVDLQSSKSSVTQVTVLDYVPHDHLKIQFWNTVNVSNYNYYSVHVVNATSQVINQFAPWVVHDVLGSGVNSSHTSVPIMAKHTPLNLNYTVTIRGPALRYCELKVDPEFVSLYMVMQFDFTVTFQYLTHTEQDTLSTRQQVCCVPSGNCTASQPNSYI